MRQLRIKITVRRKDGDRLYIVQPTYHTTKNSRKVRSEKDVVTRAERGHVFLFLLFCQAFSLGFGKNRCEACYKIRISRILISIQR